LAKKILNNKKNTLPPGWQDWGVLSPWCQGSHLRWHLRGERRILPRRVKIFRGTGTPKDRNEVNRRDVC
jgi:hypothetical protein